MNRFSFFEDETTAEVTAEQFTRTSSSSAGYQSPPINEVRYRTEQLNVVKVEQRIVSHADAKKEYLMQKYPGNRVDIKLLQYHYNIEPKGLDAALDAMKDLEYIKETPQLRLNNDNEIEEVLNLVDMSDKWNSHRMQIKGSEFYKAVYSKSPKAAEDILNAGDLEFKNQHNIKATYDRSMVFHVLFNDFIDISKTKTLSFLSQVFMNIPIEVLLTNKITSQDEKTLTIHTRGEVLKEKLKLAEMKAQYDMYYKPVIKYDFSEYSYEYDIIRTIDKATGNIVEANAILGETIKNNYSTATDFSLKKVIL